MNKLNVSKRQLQAMLMTAAKQDVRYYLNGILVDFDNHRLVTTDGHMALLFRPEDMTGKGVFIIERQQVESICKLGGTGQKTYEPRIEIVCTEKSIKMTHEGTEISGKPIDGKFPEIDRVVPDKFTNIPSQIQGELYGRGEKALRYIAGKSVDRYGYVHVSHNGGDGGKIPTGAAVMFLPDYSDAFAVVMPFRPHNNLESPGAIADKARSIIDNTMRKENES